MKHLIIGAGRMGRKHAQTLTRSGEHAEMVDLGFDPAQADGFDSILICTPPDAHSDLIRLFGHSRPSIPIFCEKPVLGHPGELQGAILPKVSLVACNWRWCQCYESIRQIDCGYPHDPKYGYLDLIHFLDLYWERYGEPAEFAMDVEPAGSGFISGPHRPIRFMQATIWNSYSPWCEFGGKIIHRNGPCDMFERQMKVWLDVVAGKSKSPNPIETAVERTEYLISRASVPAPSAQAI